MKKILSMFFFSFLLSTSFAQFSVIKTDMKVNDIETAIDIVGKMHNDYLSFIYSNIESKKLDPKNSDFLNQVGQLSEEYFSKLGITSSVKMSQELILKMSQENQSFTQFDLSKDANSYLSTLQNIVNESNDAATTNEKCKELIRQVLSSLNDNDKLVVGSAISVVAFSSLYWEENADKWLSYFPESNVATRQLPGWLVSDGLGAISGAIHGLGGGPAGSFAGALVEGGASSCVHLIGHGFHWWD